MKKNIRSLSILGTSKNSVFRSSLKKYANIKIWQSNKKDILLYYENTDITSLSGLPKYGHKEKWQKDV